MAKKIEVPSEESESRTPSRSPTNRRSSANVHHNGAIPRTRDDEANRRQRRRRLDSLNLEMTNHRSSPEHLTSSGILDYIMEPWNFANQVESRSPQETAMEGQELYLHFFHERLRGEGLSSPRAEEGLHEYHDPNSHLSDDEEFTFFSRRNRRLSMNLQNFQNPMWRQAGRELNALAARFARSEERDIVRLRAEQLHVNNSLKNLDCNKFIALLKELFPNGEITRERILVLFFFCSDVAIIALKHKLDGMLGKLTEWTLLFIREQVSDWVQRNGGWKNVLSTSLNIAQQIAVVGMCTAVITACFIYVRKNFR